MARKAKRYARLESQSGSAERHIRYLLDDSASHENAVTWTKGISKKAQMDLAGYWAGVDGTWKESKESGKIGKNSRVTYMQQLVALPNEITEKERHSLVKQILKLFPQKHPVTVVSHDASDGNANKHLHLVFSYRKYGNGKVDREFQQGYKHAVQNLLPKMYRKYGFTVVRNKKQYRVAYKPQKLMRALLYQYGRSSLRSVPFLKASLLPELKAELVLKRNEYNKLGDRESRMQLIAASRAVEWLGIEIDKAYDIKKLARRKPGVKYTRNVDTIIESKQIWTQPLTTGDLIWTERNTKVSLRSKSEIASEKLAAKLKQRNTPKIVAGVFEELTAGTLTADYVVSSKAQLSSESTPRKERGVVLTSKKSRN